MTTPSAEPLPVRGSARLQRSRTDRVIAGVAGGLGRHLGIDPLVVRIVLVVLAFAGGSGVLAYVVAWVLMPEEPTGIERPPAGDGSSASVRLGAILVTIGALMLAEMILPVALWRYALPAALIVLGVLLLTRRSGRTS